MNIKEIQKPEDTNRILNTWYPKWFEGNAYLTRSRKNIVMMNSRENTDQAQWYGLNVKDAIENFPLIERISGSVKLWQYAVLSHANETVMIHANSVNGSVFEMQIKAKEKVNLRLSDGQKTATID